MSCEVETPVSSSGKDQIVTGNPEIQDLHHPHILLLCLRGPFLPSQNLDLGAADLRGLKMQPGVQLISTLSWAQASVFVCERRESVLYATWEVLWLWYFTFSW